MSENWTSAEIPDQSGRTAVITGANSGLGLQTAKALAGAGATVLMACRSREKADAARAQILSAQPQAELEIVELDLGDLSSIEAAASTLAARPGSIDLLINNAGVMAPPRMETADGFELQLGTNHLGHFALTGRLLPKLLEAEAGRVVNVSSLAHRQGELDFDDLNWERDYSRWAAYGRSKLANLLFTFELDRRLREGDRALLAAAAHPGYSNTNLQSSGPGAGRLGALVKPLAKISNLILAQSDAQGALPSLYAATAPEVIGSNYVGPDGIGEARGHPTLVGCTSAAKDMDDAARLWEVSEELTGVRYPI